jgi:hypothetical protein
MTTSPTLRSARAAVFAVVCIAVSALGHTMVSPASIPLHALFPAWVVVFTAARCAAGRERGFGAVAALMLAAQGALHLWFAATTHAIAAHPATTCMSMPGMPPVMSMPASCPVGSEAALPPWAMSAAMLAAHLAAALAGAWWLHRGEAALYALGRMLAIRTAHLWTLLLLLRAPAPHPAPAAECWTDTAHTPLPLAAVCFPVVRRGPPAACVSL